MAMPPSSEHWSFCAYLARSLPLSFVSIVSYPLAPHTPAPAALPTRLALVESMMTPAKVDHETVTLVGDSAGGNVALATTIEALRQNYANSSSSTSGGIHAPHRWLLISPA